jgi:hypothetical protein
MVISVHRSFSGLPDLSSKTTQHKQAGLPLILALLCNAWYEKIAEGLNYDISWVSRIKRSILGSKYCFVYFVFRVSLAF